MTLNFRGNDARLTTASLWERELRLGLDMLYDEQRDLFFSRELLDIAGGTFGDSLLVLIYLGYILLNSLLLY
jgi:hypothetical protein